MIGRLKYVKGDATNPNPDRTRYIIQIVNNGGFYGAGFSGAISRRWPKVEDEYRKWYRSQQNFKLGEVQFVYVQSDIVVVNMIAQEGIRTDEENQVPPIRYEALEKCLEKVAKEVMNDGASVHTGRIGAGLAGGDFKIIESLINKHFIDKNINVTIYDLP